jgi:hypothetical protein
VESSGELLVVWKLYMVAAWNMEAVDAQVEVQCCCRWGSSIRGVRGIGGGGRGSVSDGEAAQELCLLILTLNIIDLLTYHLKCVDPH